MRGIKINGTWRKERECISNAESAVWKSEHNWSKQDYYFLVPKLVTLNQQFENKTTIFWRQNWYIFLLNFKFQVVCARLEEFLSLPFPYLLWSIVLQATIKTACGEMR